MSLSVRKLTSRIGAVIAGVDLTAEPSGDVSHYSRFVETAA
jgi:hypothetical protein